MDVFRTFPNYSKSLSKSQIKKVKKNRHGMILKDSSDRPYKSSREIREKLKAHISKNTASTTKIKGQKLGSGFMKSSDDVKGDVGLNNPNDPVTREKLKGLLGSGGIMFGDKEREVLAKILHKS